MLERLAHAIVRRRRIVIAVWIVMTLFGGFSAGQVSKRWLTSFSIPGYSAYEANQRTLHTFGNGAQAPMVAVFESRGEAVADRGIEEAINAAQKVNPGSRVSSYFSTGSSAYVSADGHATFATIYPAGIPDFAALTYIKPTRDALIAATPMGVTSYLTGRDAIYADSTNGGGGPSVAVEALIGGLGALVILFFVFGTLPAVAMPLAIAIA